MKKFLTVKTWRVRILRMFSKLTSIATFPSDYNGNETIRWTAGISHFYYGNSHLNYHKGVRPADLIHLHNLGFQHKNKAETDNVKTHAGTDGQEGQQTEASSAAPTHLQQESNTNTETRASIEDNGKKDVNVNYNSSDTARTISSDVVCSIISKSVHTSPVQRLDTRRTESYY